MTSQADLKMEVAISRLLRAGTTIAALHVLERAGLRTALIDAIQAAAERSRELS